MSLPKKSKNPLDRFYVNGTKANTVCIQAIYMRYSGGRGGVVEPYRTYDSESEQRACLVLERLRGSPGEQAWAELATLVRWR